MNILEAHSTTQANLTIIMIDRQVVDQVVKSVYTIDHTTGVVSRKEGKFRTISNKQMQDEINKEIEEIKEYLKS